MCKENQCLYCENITKEPHFVSGCCGRGMCDECYDNLQGTEEQIQVDHFDFEGNEYDVIIYKGREHHDFICFDCYGKAKEEKRQYDIKSE